MLVGGLNFQLGAEAEMEAQKQMLNRRRRRRRDEM